VQDTEDNDFVGTRNVVNCIFLVENHTQIGGQGRTRGIGEREPEGLIDRAWISDRNSVATDSDVSSARELQISARSASAVSVRRSLSDLLITSSHAR